MTNCTLCHTPLVALYTAQAERAMRTGLVSEPYGYSCPKCESKAHFPLFDFQPQATIIRPADGECPDCDSVNFFSYRLPSDDDLPVKWDDGRLWENCGYYCENCGWGNGGKREHIPLGQS